MPTHEWTMANDEYGSPPHRRRKTRVIIAMGVLGFLGLFAVLSLIGVPGGSAPSLDAKSYRTNVDCQVNTVGSRGTVTISGTIKGDATSHSVTVEVLDAASHQRIGVQTFEVRGTTSFGCKIAKVA